MLQKSKHIKSSQYHHNYRRVIRNSIMSIGYWQGRIWHNQNGKIVDCGTCILTSIADLNNRISRLGLIAHARWEVIDTSYY